jgi:hypothetical protein
LLEEGKPLLVDFTYGDFMAWSRVNSIGFRFDFKESDGPETEWLKYPKLLYPKITFVEPCDFCR